MNLKSSRIIGAFLLAALMASPAGGQAVKKDYPIQPVDFTKVRIDDAFWKPKMETNRRVPIPFAIQWSTEFSITARVSGVISLRESKG